MRPAAAAENAGIPSVVIANTGFLVNATLTGKSWGIENIQVAEYPGALAIHSREDMQKNIREVLVERVIAGLTQRAQASASADLARTARHDPIVFTGTYDEVNRYFQEQEWSDGLAIVPPTAERIEQFVSCAGRRADEEIAVLPPARLRATPRNIAANAIMAGCEPQHMPLLIAATEALAAEEFNVNNLGSTSGILPFLFVNGPLVSELGIACEGQLVSRGPNPALGRALGLIVRNIAGYRPGRNYMGSFGYPLAFALAENEHASPWNPYHVDRGFERTTSTVTLGVTNNWGHAPAPASAPDRSGADITLEVLCGELRKRVRVYSLAGAGRGEHQEIVMITILMSPPVARALADAGYSKRAVAEYLYENARAPRSDFDWARRYTGGTRLGPAETEPEDQSGPPGEMLRLISSPDVVHIIVCGDPNRNRLMLFEGGHAVPATRAIRPA